MASRIQSPSFVSGMLCRILLSYQALLSRRSTTAGTRQYTIVEQKGGWHSPTPEEPTRNDLFSSDHHHTQTAGILSGKQHWLAVDLRADGRSKILGRTNPQILSEIAHR